MKFDNTKIKDLVDFLQGFNMKMSGICPAIMKPCGSSYQFGGIGCIKEGCYTEYIEKVCSDIENMIDEKCKNK